MSGFLHSSLLSVVPFPSTKYLFPEGPICGPNLKKNYGFFIRIAWKPPTKYLCKKCPSGGAICEKNSIFHPRCPGNLHKSIFPQKTRVV